MPKVMQEIHVSIIPLPTPYPFPSSLPLFRTLPPDRHHRSPVLALLCGLRWTLANKARHAIGLIAFEMIAFVRLRFMQGWNDSNEGQGRFEWPNKRHSHWRFRHAHQASLHSRPSLVTTSVRCDTMERSAPLTLGIAPHRLLHQIAPPMCAPTPRPHSCAPFYHLPRAINDEPKRNPTPSLLRCLDLDSPLSRARAANIDVPLASLSL